MTINHHRAEQMLSAYLDGELLPREAVEVQAHLLECSACRKAYERLRETKDLLGQLPVAEPPAEFWTAIRTPRALPMRERLRWRPPVWRWTTWGIAAALLVLAVALVPVVKGTVDRLHAAEIGVDLYVRDHALQMSHEPLVDRAYLGLITGDSDLKLVGEPARYGEGTP